jgi:hypothetical protein
LIDAPWFLGVQMKNGRGKTDVRFCSFPLLPRFSRRRGSALLTTGMAPENRAAKFQDICAKQINRLF